MTSSFDLAQRLQQRRQQQLYRQRRLLGSAQGAQVRVDGRDCLAFCNNDYLGLANHPYLAEAMAKAARQYGVGSGASHLVLGHSELHHQLEEALARFCQRPRALLFSTGYMANLGTLTALLDKQGAVFEDRLNHASLLDGGLLSGARFQRYLHNDVASLQQRLASSEASAKLVVTDGVFSMDGDIAPLPQLAEACQQAGAWLMVDDAHGFGVLGEQGYGCLEHFALNHQQVPILMGTLGKALGTAGAFVAGSEELIEALIQFARPYIYTTAMPPAVAAATLASLQLVQQENWRRQHLQQLIRWFSQQALAEGLPLMPSSTPIQPLLVGEAEQALALSEALWQKGMLVTAIRPPTVPAGSARLRITLSAAHSQADVEHLLDALLQSWREVQGG